MQDAVFIAGSGTIGLLVLVLARLSGAGRIIVSDLSDDRLHVARQLGADVTVNAAHTDPVATVMTETGGAGADVAFEAVGAEASASQTTAATRSGGTVVWLGNSVDKIEISMQTVVTRSLRLLGAYGMTTAELERSIDLLASGKIPAELIIGRHATLEEGPVLFEELLESQSTIKCLIVP